VRQTCVDLYAYLNTRRQIIPRLFIRA